MTDERYFVATTPVIPLIPGTGIMSQLQTVLRTPGIVWLRPGPVSEVPGPAVSPGPVSTGRAGGVTAQPHLGAPGQAHHHLILSLVSHRHQVGL